MTMNMGEDMEHLRLPALRHVIVLLAAGVLLAAPATAQFQQPFSGCWEWTGTTYADGSTETPADLGHGVQLCFLDDGTFVRYHDEAPVEADGRRDPGASARPPGLREDEQSGREAARDRDAPPRRRSRPSRRPRWKARPRRNRSMPRHGARR